jgi:hypothetical protein
MFNPRHKEKILAIIIFGLIIFAGILIIKQTIYIENF